MKDLEYYKKEIQNKRKNTPFRAFLKEIVSWKPFGFYKNSGLISRYPDTPRIKNIVSPKEFLKIRDSLPTHEYDPAKTFFKNFEEFFHIIPLASLVHFHNNENVDFSDCVFIAKNVYLSTVIGVDAENIYYSAFSYINIKNIFNSILVSRFSENIYQSVFVGNSFKIFYSKFIQNSSDIWFSTNLVGCHDCILCDGLENASYHIANKKLEKQEYEKQKKKILENKSDFMMYFQKLPAKAINYNSKNVTGNAIYFSENVENGEYSAYVKDSRNVVFGNGDLGGSDFYDCFDVGVNSNNFYGVCSAGETGANHLYSCYEVGSSSNMFYCYHMESSSHCIGCIGLRNKHFCIFNKEYSKEEWHERATAILEQMEQEGSLGDFFPSSLNPFYFNDTMAYMFDSTFTKEEAQNSGFLWREDKIRVDIPASAELINIEDLSRFEGLQNGGWYISEDILKKVIQDSEGNYYRIIKEEYDFLVKYSLPIPRIHWFERISQSIKSL